MTKNNALSRDGSRHVTDERINTITHLAAACMSIPAVGYLIIRSIEVSSIWAFIGVLIYGISLTALFIFSTLHHGISGSPTTNKVLRTIDYAAVFLLISGTVTSIVLLAYRDLLGLVVLVSTWLIAAIGITLRSAIQQLPKYITNTFYIVLGWLPVVLVVVQPSQLPALSATLLAAGGMFYSIGFAVYAVEKPNIIPSIFGFHELWHLLVVSAAGLHYAAILVLLMS